jgi:hypothetical protein
MNDVECLAETLDDIIIENTLKGRLREFLDICVDSLYDGDLENSNKLIECLHDYDHTRLTENVKDEIGLYLIRESTIEELKENIFSYIKYEN